ncbi:MAG: phosphodiester glycosidase family protein, partial [Muribaculaceae bacterium]|nr:phosphodiester glycosidase family protein [Muribaculaceae bacterium]
MKSNLILGLLLASSVTATAANTDIQGVSFQVDTISHYKIGPGLTQSHLVFKSSSRTFHAFLTDMHVPEADGLRVKVDVGRDSCNTAEAITSIAKRKTNANTQYLAGINGDFFITSSFANQHEFKNAILGYPNMSCATEGKLVAPDMIDITSRENALIIGSEGMWIDATDMKYRVLNNAGDTIVDAKAMNYPRRDEEMVVYNSYMGKYTKTSPQGREIVLRPAEGATWKFNKSIKFIVDGDWHAGQSAIPEDGLVISCGPKYKNEFIDGLKKGDIVKLKLVVSLPAFSKLKPDIQEICGGDVRILKENVTTTEAIRWINTPSAKYSRSLVGYSKDRDHVVTCAIDASSVSSGVTYYEAADVMRFLGCWDALDLDGGGSTAIWTQSHGIMNNLRDGSERAVGNGIFFVLDRPASKEVKSIRFADWRQVLPQYGLYRPVIYGYNEYGQLVDTDIQGFTLEAPAELGTVDGTALLASGSGPHNLTARLGDMTADIAVTVDNSFPAKPREAS